MAHCSLGSDNNQLIKELQSELSLKEVSLNECTIRIFNGDEMQWDEIRQGLREESIPMPPIEIMESQGLRVSKDGAVNFFSP